MGVGLTMIARFFFGFRLMGLLLVELILKLGAFKCFYILQLCIDYILTDVHIDTSSKFGYIFFDEKVFGRFICNCLNCYFTTSGSYLHLNCFFNLFPPFISGPSNSDLLYERQNI